MTCVVNVKVKYIRPKYHNLKKWIEDDNNVYIGRRGVVFIDGARFPPKDSPYANPYKVTGSNTREMCIRDYELWLREMIIGGKITPNKLKAMYGKNLGCWCAPEYCHGNVLKKYIVFYHHMK